MAYCVFKFFGRNFGIIYVKNRELRCSLVHLFSMSGASLSYSTPLDNQAPDVDFECHRCERSRRTLRIKVKSYDS